MYEWNSDYNPSMAAAAPISYVQGIANPYTSYGTYAETTWYTEEAALWNESVKTIFDPSPAGYRIPSEAEMSQLSETYRSISSIMVGGYEYSYLIREMASGNIFNPSRTGMYIDNGTFRVTSWRPGFFWTNSSSGSIPKECDLGSSPVDSKNYRNLILPVRE